jgi:hypothetical protein
VRGQRRRLTMVGGDRQRRGRGATSIKTTVGRRSWIVGGQHTRTGIARRKPQESDENYLGRRDRHFLLHIVEINQPVQMLKTIKNRKMKRNKSATRRWVRIFLSLALGLLTLLHCAYPPLSAATLSGSSNVQPSTPECL